MIKALERLHIFLLLLSSVFMSFVWGAQTLYYVVFFAALWGGIYVMIANKLKKNHIIACAVFIFASLLSALSGRLVGDIPFNWSWISQMLLFPFVILGIRYLHLKHFDFFEGQLKLMFYVALAVLLTQQCVNIWGYGISHLLLLSDPASFMRGAYYYHNIAAQEIGLLKSIIPFVAFLFFLSTRHRFQRGIQICMFIFILLSTLLVAAKANLIGILILCIVWGAAKINSIWLKGGFVFVILISLFLMTVLYYEDLTEYSIYNGRYLLPVIMSPDFWGLPFGVGMGNYVYAASINLIEVNTNGVLPVFFPVSMYSSTSLFPIAESDVLLLSVSFGWFFYIAYLMFISVVIYKYMFTRAIYSPCYKRGAELIVYLFFVGLYQDFFNVHTYWVFFAVAISCFSMSSIPKNSEGSKLKASL